MRLPFVPPETHLEKWRASLQRMLAIGCKRITPTHFGIYEKAEAHLSLAVYFLDDVETWIEQHLPGNPDGESLNVHYSTFLQTRGLAAGLDGVEMEMYKSGNPTSFTANGLSRYWQKVRNET
jgi:hypothetical protein